VQCGEPDAEPDDSSDTASAATNEDRKSEEALPSTPRQSEEALPSTPRPSAEECKVEEAKVPEPSPERVQEMPTDEGDEEAEVAEPSPEKIQESIMDRVPTPAREGRGESTSPDKRALRSKIQEGESPFSSCRTPERCQEHRSRTVTRLDWERQPEDAEPADEMVSPDYQLMFTPRENRQEKEERDWKLAEVSRQASVLVHGLGLTGLANWMKDSAAPPTPPEQGVGSFEICFDVSGSSKVGIGFKQLPPEPLVVRKVTEGSWAEGEGVQVGDTVTHVNGVKASCMTGPQFLRLMGLRPLRLIVEETGLLK